MSDFSLTVREEGDLVIIETSGYLADLLKCAAVDRPRLIDHCLTYVAANLVMIASLVSPLSVSYVIL